MNPRSSYRRDGTQVLSPSCRMKEEERAQRMGQGEQPGRPEAKAWPLPHYPQPSREEAQVHGSKAQAKLHTYAQFRAAALESRANSQTASKPPDQALHPDNARTFS